MILPESRDCEEQWSGRLRSALSVSLMFVVNMEFEYTWITAARVTWYTIPWERLYHVINRLDHVTPHVRSSCSCVKPYILVRAMIDTTPAISRAL